MQRSGFPEAYADHEADARVLASALTGNSPATPSAATWTPTWPRSATRLDETGPDAPRRRSCAARSRRRSATWRSAASSRGGVDAGHMQGSAHYEGRAIDIFVRPVSAENRQRGWAIAQYLVGPGRPARHPDA